jgi:hypothetical protein
VGGQVLFRDLWCYLAAEEAEAGEHWLRALLHVFPEVFIELHCAPTSTKMLLRSVQLRDRPRPRCEAQARKNTRQVRLIHVERDRGAGSV